jgi:LPXTG-motif cell wall-anchored protein
MTRHRLVLGFIVAAVLAVGLGGMPSATAPARASTPTSSNISVPSSVGASNAKTWTGTVTGPGQDNDGDCTNSDSNVDGHTINLTVPNLPTELTYKVTFKAEWSDSVQDLILTVMKGNKVIGTSDGGSPVESYTIAAAEPGTYKVYVCPFLTLADTAYTGTVTTNTLLKKLPKPVDSQGLKFSAAVPADIQRDEGEPVVEIDKSGRVYTCGPTGFSQAQDYAQVSTDGGDQFHLLGEPPRGQFSAGGGGDCTIATSPEKNAEGNYQWSYSGLSGLLEFATATSPDGGKTITPNALSLVGPLVDRQWIVATSTTRVFQSFNRAQPRRIEVCESNDKGLTYPTCTVVGPDSLFPGPMKMIPGNLNPVNPGKPIVYFPWSQDTTVKLAVSMDDGDTWNNCLVGTTAGEPGNLFPVADADKKGNIYVAYGDDGDFNIYMKSLKLAKLANCQGGTAGRADFMDDPGFSDPVVVNRKPVQTALFPWLVASGKPGRVGVAMYGTQTPGRGDSLKPKSWNVYVNQSLNALSASPDFSQVRATTHPMHYDQVCLFGIACTAGGDRSLVDFFAIDYNPRNGEYVVVFDTAHKRPDDVAGTVSTPMVFRQIAGPSNGGGTVDRRGRSVLRKASDDPKGDALAEYSSLVLPPESSNVPAADIEHVEVGPAIDPATGKPYGGGGFTVTMKVDDLSDAALTDALMATDLDSPSLLYIFRFVDGYRYAAVQANYDRLRGFTFGHSDYGASASECGTPETGVAGDDQCLQYHGETTIPGAVNQAKGTITLTAPLELLQALKGGIGPGERPAQVPATKGSRLYDAAAFVQAASLSPEDQLQGFLYPLDNSPAMDFLIPTAKKPGFDDGNGNGNGGDGNGNGGDGGDDSGILPDDGTNGVLPATGNEPALTLLGMVVLALGGWVALRRRRA